MAFWICLAQCAYLPDQLLAVLASFGEMYMNAAPTKPWLRTAEAEPSSPIRTRLSAPNAAHTTFRFRDTASYSANKRFAAPADSEPRESIRGQTMRRNEIVTQEASTQPIGVELIAMLVAVADGRPLAMTIEDGGALPSGPFEVGHRSLQSGLRAWVERQTRHSLGYVEQLYTFADSDRRVAADGARAISISYLGLMREERTAGSQASWRPWYDYFPWEDHRAGAPRIITDAIAPGLVSWIEAGEGEVARRTRAAIAFGLEGRPWNEDLVLQRYELLYEAGLIEEARRRSGDRDRPPLGKPMIGDHRRILATGIARVRAKIK